MSVIRIDSLTPLPDSVRGAVLTIGNFDGVHRGHARLVGRLRDRARTVGAPAVAVTFDPHPVALLRPEAAPVPLTWTERTAALLLEAGATSVGVFQTGPWLLDLSARAFFERIILDQFGARGLVEGPTFGFGRGREGDVGLLGSWCDQAGISFEVVPPVEIDGQIVSSSRIRALLAAGDTREAGRLLGRPHRIRGQVVPGAGRGRGLGFPTANLQGIDTQIPADGVYAARAWTSNPPRPCPAAVHIGANATFHATQRTVEAHLIGFRDDLYGQTIELDFLERLRGTRKFDGVSELLDQIRVDVEQAWTIALGSP